MLKNLRRKFVIIIMVLVGTVLVSVLGGSYASTWQTQHDIADDALKHSIEGSMFDLPRIAIRQEGEHPDHPKDGARANMLVLAVDLDANGVVLATNDAPIVIDSATLSNVIDTALKSPSETGWDDSLHVAWRRAQRSSGAWRVAIADTSAIDLSLQSLAVKDLVIIFVAMGVLLIISICLSTWVLKPVAQAWEQQRRFVADASHELKTPLAVIIANMQILKADTSLSPESMRWVNSTADESTHMKNLVEELLELARTDESSMGTQDVMRKERVDFSDLVESSALEFDAIAFERGTQIDQDIEEGLFVQGDPEWLGRLCKILVDNACKYSSVGTPVTVTLTHEGRHGVLTVNNHGNVIDPQDLPHVFDRFYRTDKARSRSARTGGFGLGLAIAKGIATSHGGDISVTSTEQDGTTFRVSLPLAS
ncbi:MAG: sensor histidine kinase [Atopobiaceae bacterium]|nr:sensor histidine kinase [Atopobiaceae bacterium]